MDKNMSRDSNEEHESAVQMKMVKCDASVDDDDEKLPGIQLLYAEPHDDIKDVKLYTSPFNNTLVDDIKCEMKSESSDIPEFNTDDDKKIDLNKTQTVSSQVNRYKRKLTFLGRFGFVSFLDYIV